MRKLFIAAAVIVTLAVASPAGERPVIPCTSDLECAVLNPDICGGPYEPACHEVPR